MYDFRTIWNRCELSLSMSLSVVARRAGTGAGAVWVG